MRKAWVITVDMGYGHQRAANPFQHIAEERIITANKDRIISKGEEGKWRLARSFYESISRMQSLPVIGKHLFNLYDILQHIPQFHPFRDLSRPSVQAIYTLHQIRNGLCKSLFDYVMKKDCPVLTPYFITAIAGEYYGAKHVYCICTDTDINRVWVPVDTRKTKIIYCAPCREVEKRLLEYGVPQHNIFLTGFPLPLQNLGHNQRILKHDLAQRIYLLDPKKTFLNRTSTMVESYLKQKVRKPNRPLTIMFSIGGAGAQYEIVIEVMDSLKQMLLHGEIRLVVAVGTNLDILMKIRHRAGTIGLHEGLSYKMVHSLQLKEYFDEFNKALRSADILWTKPSELSFFAGLGIPLICAPPVGYHEERNLEWLKSLGLGFPQENPRYVHDWLPFWLEDGRLAEAAFEGPIKIITDGTDNIINLVFGKGA